MSFIRDKYISHRIKLMATRARNWDIEKPLLEQKQKIKQEKAAIINKEEKNKLAFGKLLMIFLFINFTFLELFTCAITIYSFSLAFAIGMMPDFTPLITLLGSVIGETLSFGIYCAKSKAENTKGGIVYETALREYDNNDDESVG